MNDVQPQISPPIQTIQNIPITPQEKKRHEGEWTGGLSYMDDPNYHRMSELLDISYEDRRDSQLAEKISFLTDWAKEHTKSEDRLQHYMAIKELSRGLGFTEIGKTLLLKLYRWTKLDTQRKRVEKEMELIK